MIYHSRPGPGFNRQARSGKACSFFAAGLINIINVIVPMATQIMLVM